MIIRMRRYFALGIGINCFVLTNAKVGSSTGLNEQPDLLVNT
jgi:hypothetical protein